MLSCPICGKEFKSVAGLKTHARREHFASNRCPVCGKEFKNDDSLMMHLKWKKKVCEKHLVVYYLIRRVRGGWPEGRRAFKLIKKGLRI